MRTHALHHLAHVVHQVVELLRHQAELLEDVRKVLNLFYCVSMAAAFALDNKAGRFILRAQFNEFFARQFRIDRVIVVGAVVFALFVFIFVVVAVFLRQLRADVGGGRRQIFFSVWIHEAGDQVGEARFARFDFVVLLQQIGNGFRIFRNRTLYLVDTVFDTLGDVDFAFARQQLNGTHFAHIHAHRVGGAANFRFYAG